MPPPSRPRVRPPRMLSRWQSSRRATFRARKCTIVSQLLKSSLTKFLAWRKKGKALSWRKAERLPFLRFGANISAAKSVGRFRSTPVEAAGVRQVHEAYQQLTEQASARQIEGVKRFLTFNMGGSLTTSVAMIW